MWGLSQGSAKLTELWSTIPTPASTWDSFEPTTPIGVSSTKAGVAPEPAPDPRPCWGVLEDNSLLKPKADPLQDLDQVSWPRAPCWAMEQFGESELGASVMKDHHEWGHQGEATRPSTTVLGNLPLPSPIPDTNTSGKQDPPLPVPPSPHLLGGGSAQDGAEGVDSERGEGVDHQGQQDHEQDTGVGQGIPAGICQHRELGVMSEWGRGRGQREQVLGDRPPPGKVLGALKRRWHLNWS